MILERISQETGLGLRILSRITTSANHRYKVYYIPKRRGGERRIQHPSRELKFIQRWIAENVLSKLPVHEAALGYRKGINIHHVASMHSKNNFLLILDLANFFESINKADVFGLLRRNAGRFVPELTEEDALVISRVATRYGRLTIGAPSSPILSNAVMYEFDAVISSICKGSGVLYSRYADDMHFSSWTPGVLSDIAARVRGEVERIETPNLILNDKKTVFTSRRHKRMVVGLTLTSDRRISLGRKRKRALKSLVFRHKCAAMSSEERAYLAGYLAFTKSVDPAFLGSLERKYGRDVVARAIQTTDLGG